MILDYILTVIEYTHTHTHTHIYIYINFIYIYIYVCKILNYILTIIIELDV